MHFRRYCRRRRRNLLTLKKLKDTGNITLGHRESSIPFSYYNDQQQVIGYSQELMLKAVDGVKERTQAGQARHQA